MKHLSRLILIVMLMTGIQTVSSAQAFSGDFTKRGTIGGTFATDSATVSRATPDTFACVVNPHRNSVGFTIQAKPISGSAHDSTVIEVWGTKTYNGSFGWTLIDTFQMSTAQTYQYFDVNPVSWPGNPYTGYMFIMRSAALTSTYTTRWRVHALIR